MKTEMTEDQFSVTVGFHQGKALMTLAGLYTNLAAVIEEVDQNAIDAGATRIRNVIDLTKGECLVYDNGTGASREKIAKALDSIRSTMKTRDKYGQFGLGLISPLSISSEFTITTCPDSRVNSFSQYAFNAKDIEPQKSVVIPGNTVSGLTHDPEGEVWWRTRVHARGVTKDHRKTNTTAEDIAEGLSLKFGEAISERGIKITIEFKGRDGKKTEVEVKPREFTGQPLDTFESSSKEGGRVEAKLYIARLERRGRKGEVTFGRFDNPSRITAKQFADCTNGIIDAKVSAALLSGTFEGVVLCEQAKIQESRSRFEDNDALLALCVTLEDWHKKVGKKVIESTTEQDSDQRFQKIGTEVMPFAELLLRQEQFKNIADKIEVGTIGTDPAKVPKKKILGTDEGTSVSVGGGPFVDKPDRKKGDGSDGGKPVKTELPEHHPGTVYGPRGKKRVEVKGSSTGLRFEYVELENFRIPFIFDVLNGTVSFNMTNPNWGLCQESDGYLRQYHMAVLTTALSLETYRSTDGVLNNELEKFAFESINHQAFAITNGDAMMGVEQPKKKKK